MGVHGLWRLIEPSGKPVPLETLENQILAIGILLFKATFAFFHSSSLTLFDVSIWLHHFVKGFQDARGAPLPNAHLLGIYHRLCKLLYFRIKPVFVFDGGVPALKKQTIALRNQQKSKTLSEADRIHKNLLSALVKHNAISRVLSEKAKAAIIQSPPKTSKTDADDDLYKLEPLNSSLSESEEENSNDSSKHYDLHSIDTQSAEFKSLPVDVRHDILTDLKETRKQSSWGRLHELPTESDDFSGYQMKRLLKRQSVQTALEDVEKEMGGHSLSLGELEKLLKDQGVITNLKGSRIASDENTRFLLIKDLKQALEEAKKMDLESIDEENEIEETKTNKGDVEFEDELKKAIALSMEEIPSTSKSTEVAVVNNKMQLSFLDDADFDDDSSEEEEVMITKLTPAQRYMTEYSGLTPNEISKILASNTGTSKNQNGEQNKVPVNRKTEAMPSKLDSDSETSDDFLDVEDETEKAMEVVIKPDEEIEDDLFKDVFEQSESIQKPDVSNVSENDETVGEKLIRERDDSIRESEDSVVLEDETGQNKPSSPTIKDKIEEMVREYSSNSGPESSALTVEHLNQMRDNLRQEQVELVTERSAKERHAGNITDQMYQEAQELLELFGVPYLIAPMEAEAQCAFLELIDLTNGTITDDSDIWLFGGQTVYKNFFNQSKNVQEFKSENIQHHYKLSREQMILLAMLVGSDYTTGLSGVGPVTALEILAAFPPKSQHLISGLSEFKSWFIKGKLPGPGRTSLRNKLKNLILTDNFPNPQIVDAYLQPRVETDKEEFTWGKPDVVGLTEFAKKKFGWTQIRTEQMLKPVLKRLEERNSQKPITDFFKYEIKTSNQTENKMSKRVKCAISKLGKSSSVGDEVEEEPKKKRSRKKKDEEIEILKETKVKSKKRMEDIQNEIEKKVDLQKLHKRESIPQKQKSRDEMLKNKLKAIETFRKSKQGPGFVKKGGKVKKALKEDAGYLSENSSSDS